MSGRQEDELPWTGDPECPDLGWFCSDWTKNGLSLILSLSLPVIGFALSAALYFLFKSCMARRSRRRRACAPRGVSLTQLLLNHRLQMAQAQQFQMGQRLRIAMLWKMTIQQALQRKAMHEKLDDLTVPEDTKKKIMSEQQEQQEKHLAQFQVSSKIMIGVVVPGIS